jgi:hypothetical protein
VLDVGQTLIRAGEQRAAACSAAPPSTERPNSGKGGKFVARVAGVGQSWQPGHMQAMEFDTVVVSEGRGRVLVPIPFDPDQLWGAKPRHHVAGTVNGVRVRAVIEVVDDGLGFILGPAWRRDCGIEAGERVTVHIAPEGPQRDELPADLAEALDANPLRESSSTPWRSSIARAT